MKRMGKLTELLRTCGTPEEVFGIVSTLSLEYGFEYTAFAQVGGTPNRDSLTIEHRGLLNYPDTWIQSYEEGQFHRNDPIIERGRLHEEPFLWSQLEGGTGLSSDERRMMGAARESGLKEGVTIPFRGRTGKLSVMCYVTSQDTTVTDAQFNEIQALSSMCFMRIDKLFNEEQRVSELSPRQVECLYWTAMGKSSREIADLLDLKENTVTYHIKVAMARLGTNNRTVAVLRCIAAGAFYID